MKRQVHSDCLHQLFHDGSISIHFQLLRGVILDTATCLASFSLGKHSMSWQPEDVMSLEVSFSRTGVNGEPALCTVRFPSVAHVTHRLSGCCEADAEAFQTS